MERRLLAADGAGLAATQVGILRNVFVYRVDVDAPVEVLVNPQVVASSQERATFVEGCLSFNSVWVAVERAAAVVVTGHDLEGRTRTIDAEGVIASLLQHEIDHLDGILTLDRAAAKERRRAVTLLLAQRRAAA